MVACFVKLAVFLSVFLFDRTDTVITTTGGQDGQTDHGNGRRSRRG